MKKIALFLCLHILTSDCFAQENPIHTVLFENDRFEISDDQARDLKNWLLSFKDSIKRIDIIGYTDHLGSAEYNEELSKSRANTVLHFVSEIDGLWAKMIMTQWKGERLSQQPNNTVGVPKDRKVEVIVQLSGQRLKNSEIDRIETAEVGESIVLNNLNFIPGRHFLVPQSKPEMLQLIKIMKENPTLEIEIQGHICCKLHSEDGMDIDTRTYSLSLNRAKHIRNQLMDAGISAERMKYIGFAGTKPLVEPELTAEDRNRNRRVEIRILKK